MIRQFSKKVSKHNAAKDWHADDLVVQREALKLEMDRGESINYVKKQWERDR